MPHYLHYQHNRLHVFVLETVAAAGAGNYYTVASSVQPQKELDTYKNEVVFWAMKSKIIIS